MNLRDLLRLRGGFRNPPKSPPTPEPPPVEPEAEAIPATFDLFALRSFVLKPERATQELADKVGWWTDGCCRVWRSPSYDREGAWEDGTCTAKCYRHRSTAHIQSWGGGTIARLQDLDEHEAPHEGCNCGIYGSLSYADLINQFPTESKRIVAVIAAEGQTLVGSRGLRTAFARVVAYWTAPDIIGRQVAAQQFQDAKAFDTPFEMVEAYGLRLLPPAGNTRYDGPNWWTSGPPGKTPP